MIDEHFRMSEADGAVYDMEHLLNVKLRGDNLEKFMVEWETVLSGILHGEQPDDTSHGAFIQGALRLRSVQCQDAVKPEVRCAALCLSGFRAPRRSIRLSCADEIQSH